MISTKKILCIGGAGQLGKHVVQKLSPYTVTNIDFTACNNSKTNILLKKDSSSKVNTK